MLEYCLRISVPQDKFEAYKSWLVEHSQTVVNVPGFVSCHIFSGPSLDQENTMMVLVRYQVKSEAAFQDYLKGPAKKLRQEGVDLFGSFVTIQRDLVVLQQHLSHQEEP